VPRPEEVRGARWIPPAVVRAECGAPQSSTTRHVGDIKGAFGTIKLGETIRPAPPGLSPKLKTLLAVVGPGLIVMCGDNDAGAFSTYGQTGQDYGTSLLWVLLLLVPVLYVNQEMVVRLGAVTGVGHGKLILERFGKFWGAFSVIDLFLLNALTLVTEFIGITLAVGYLGLPKVPSIGGRRARHHRRRVTGLVPALRADRAVAVLRQRCC
jgi:hypothetical protein